MTREDFIGRIRGALHREPGDPLEAPPALLEPLTEWDTAALVELFTTELEAVGGHVYLVESLSEARAQLKNILTEMGAESFICTTDPIVDEVLSAVTLLLNDNPAAADVGVSGARCAIANTGTLVLTSEMGRKASLLPMNHVALLRAEQIVPSMAEALETYLDDLPSAWVQATGPSRTADIELTLTTGVHGPGVAHVVLIRGV
ncbi:LUD domain-containing protein [soil metagenome]